MAIVLNPVTGLRDITIYPSKPISGAAAREQIQGIIDQVAEQAAAASDFTSSLNVNGWKRNNIDGTIEQWGSFTAPNLAGGGTQQYIDIYLPITFPNSCLSAVVDIGGQDVNTNVVQTSHTPIGLDANKLSFRMSNSSVNATTSLCINWRAVGR